MKLHAVEGRLGARMPVSGLRVGWNTKGRAVPGRLRRPFIQADVTDVSISGASVIAPADKLLVPGAVVSIAAEGAVGKVVIRRVTPMTEGKQVLYGVEFIELDEQLEGMFLEQLGHGRPTPNTVIWR